MSEDVRVWRSLSASKAMIEGASARKVDMLGQLYDDAKRSVADQVHEQKLTPLSDVVVFVHVEQWCERKP